MSSPPDGTWQALPHTGPPIPLLNQPSLPGTHLLEKVDCRHFSLSRRSGSCTAVSEALHSSTKFGLDGCIDGALDGMALDVWTDVCDNA